MKKFDWKEAGELLQSGKIGVIPTDTLYGISASILFPKSIERIYEVKKRNPDKPLIIMVNSFEDLELLGAEVGQKKELLKSVWPGRVSVVLRCPGEKLTYLHRGKETLAFRLPDKKELAKLISEIGPLVSTTVNLEGGEPAKRISDIRSDLREGLDFYIDEGDFSGEHSTLIDMTGDKIKLLRKGSDFDRLEKALF